MGTWLMEEKLHLYLSKNSQKMYTDHNIFFSFSYLHVAGDTFGRPIHGQREVSGYPTPSEMNYWQAAEGIFIKPSEQPQGSKNTHDEL